MRLFRKGWSLFTLVPLVCLLSVTLLVVFFLSKKKDITNSFHYESSYLYLLKFDGMKNNIHLIGEMKLIFMQFVINLICSYIREKEMEEELLMQRREEEGRGKERRKALLEREERKWKEIESSILSSMPNVGSRDAVAMAAAVRAVGGDSALGDSFARERVSGIARRIRSSQLARRAEQVFLYRNDSCIYALSTQH